MKICCFCEIWGSGGIESFLLNIFEHMDRSGLEIDIVAEKKSSDLYTQRLKTLGIGFFELSGSTRKMAANIKQFREILHERKYDVIHLNIYQALSMLYARYAKMSGIPVRIAHAHGSGLRPSATRLLKLFIHWASKHVLSKNVSDFLACSDKSSKFMFPKGTRYEWIPNGIEISRFLFNKSIRDATRRELKLESKYIVGNVGRLCSEKNQSFLLDIMVHLRKECPESVLLLVGEGEERDYLVEKVNRLNLSDHVYFYGVSNDVPSLLWAMDVFVFASYTEGLGIAAIEAQVAGLPVLCSSGVPREAGVTESIKFLSLNAGAKLWAENILAVKGASRLKTEEILNQKGYDIKSAADKIKSFYIKGKQV